MSTAGKEKLTARHVLVVVTCIMMTFGCSALSLSTWGLFQPIVTEDLGVPTASFGLYVTVMFLTMTVMSPFAGKLLQSVDVRIVLSVSCLLVALAFFLMSIYTQIWQWYISGVLQGLGQISILYLATPMLVNNWFKVRGGLLIGIAMAFTGIGGAVWSAVFAALIGGGMTYHSVYFIWGVIALVTTLPFTLFCVRSKPEDVGLRPYGESMVDDASAGAARGVSASRAMKMPVFYTMAIFAGLANLFVMIAYQFPTYARSLTATGFDVLVVGATMSSVMMVSQAIFKVLLGVSADKNARLSLIAACTCGIVGILFCWLGASSELMLYVGAAIFGFFFATATVLVPVMATQIFGTREYSLIYSRISMVYTLLGAFASTIWAFIGSSMGFSVLFIVGLVGIVVILLLGLYSLGKVKSVQAEWTTE